MISTLVKEAFPVPNTFKLIDPHAPIRVRFKDRDVGVASTYFKDKVGPGPDYDKTRVLMLEIRYHDDLVNIPVEDMEIKPRIAVDNQIKDFRIVEIKLDRKLAVIVNLKDWICVCNSRDLFAFGCKCKPKP